MEATAKAKFNPKFSPKVNVTGPLVKAGLGKLNPVNLLLGTPAIVAETMFGTTGGDQSPFTGRYSDETSPLDETATYNGQTFDELVNDPEIIAQAAEYNMSPADLATYYLEYEYSYDKGPAIPSYFTMDELEENYGDTPFFNEYKENVPFGDKTTRVMDKYVSEPLGALMQGVGSLFTKGEKTR
jgi:predicted porin